MEHSIVITDPHHIEPSWLTDILRAAGALNRGQVIAFDIQAEDSTHANTARLLLRYSEDAQGTKPASLFLKICKASSAYFGTTEIELYTKLGRGIPASPVLTCYHYGYDANRYHLLLADVSQTHHNMWRSPVTTEYARKAAQALGALHAAWWNHPDLRADARYPHPPILAAYRDHIDAGIQPLLDATRTRITQRDIDALHLVYARHNQRMIERVAQGAPLTYIHGDPNPGNMLAPHDPTGNVYLIDRQLFDWSLGIWLGVSDIAYMMVHWWPTDVRRNLEQVVLETYLRTLAEHNVQDYTWEQLWQDYRLAAMQNIYIATDWCASDEERITMEWVWWPQLEKSLAAFHDLRCEEVLR